MEKSARVSATGQTSKSVPKERKGKSRSSSRFRKESSASAW